jgi:DNA repair exonuclease SbcCD nuclease subunit
MMSPGSSVRILFVGDMHLGRLPSRVPPAALDKGGMNLRDIGPAGTWERIVDVAIEHEVDAVALAGDLVERDNAMFEAYGPLATGVRKLVEQDIVVAGVAGNHDTRVLPKLAAEIDGFHLLGTGGTWSMLPVSGDDGLSINLVGWSFPYHHHTASPLKTAPPQPDGITFGLLHADLLDAGSRYAPVKCRVDG